MKIINNFFYTLIFSFLFLNSNCFKLKNKETIKIKVHNTFDIKLQKVEIDLEKVQKLHEMQESKNTQNNLLTNFLDTNIKIKKRSFINLGLKKTTKTMYTGFISVGNPPQEINVIFDTGSGYNWIASSFCIDNKACSGVEKYFNVTQSKSVKPTSDYYEITYGSGKLEGRMVIDEVQIAKNIIIPNETLGIIMNMEENILSDAGIAGVIGLGFPSMNDNNRTMFDSLIINNLLARNVISMYLKNDGGNINFGYIDANKYLGELNNHYVTDKWYWTLNLTDVKVGETSLDFCNNNTNCKVIIDSGCTEVVVPSKRIEERLINYVGLKEDCSNLHFLPNIIVLIDNIPYYIKPDDYIQKNIISRKCILNVSVMDDIPGDHEDTIILGESFMKNYYTVFDRDSDSIRLGKINPN